MNLEAYIASGILEAYVLGELSVREREQVELQLENHPALRDEVQRIEKTFEQLALKTAVTPPSAVKTKLLSSVNLKLTPPSAKANNVWQWLAAASIVIACGFALLAYTYYSQWNSASQQLADLELQNQQIAQSMNTVNLELSKIQADVAVLDNPQFARVTLAGTDQAPDAHATVYWNKSTAEVYLRIQNLKVLTEENQFQLWALIDGKPVDMGVFDHDKGLIKMKTTLTADAFAVTIEKRGGSLVPALNTLQVMGSTKS